MWPAGLHGAIATSMTRGEGAPASNHEFGMVTVARKTKNTGKNGIK